MVTFLKVVFFPLTVITFLAGCGGGGGEAPVSSTPPASPVLSLTKQAVKVFRFEWTDVADESEYRLLENATGSSGYSVVATVPANSSQFDLEVFLPERANASYILQACNGGGCSDSSAVFVSGSLSEAIGYVKASNSVAGLMFGAEGGVALSSDGNTMVVTAYLEDSGATGINGNQLDNSAFISGAVYVFVQDGTGTWAQQAYIKASNTDAEDYFGFGVALSGDGNTLAVGAYGEDSAAVGINGDQTDNSRNESGAVYVFVRSAAGEWSQQSYIKASNTDAGDWFGGSVALSEDGNTLAVGASGEDSAATGINGDQLDNSDSNSGAVYIFDRDNTGVWAQQAFVKGSNSNGGDWFSIVSLSNDGNTLAVGAYGERSLAGAVYVLVRDGTANWSEQAYVRASNTDAEDFFGFDVALSGDGSTLAVGALGEGSAATGIDGNQFDNSAWRSGAAYVFVGNGMGTWSQQAYIKSSNSEASPSLNGGGDEFGISLDLSDDGNTLAVGAQWEQSDAIGINGDQFNNLAGSTGAGAAYTFSRSMGVWSQQAYVKASNTKTFLQTFFGASIALSGDGATMAVASPKEYSNATGIDGDQTDRSAMDSGAVYLY